MKILNNEFISEVLSVPSYYKQETLLANFIEEWASKHEEIECLKDAKGNLRLKKGELSEGEFYPLVIAHLDTVQARQLKYIRDNERLPIIKEEKEGKTIFRCDGLGPGADDKCGVAIILSLFDKVDKLKACFFVEEEIGCVGSRNMPEEWINDIGYCISFDSPEFNRAAWQCFGVKLFDGKFYNEHLKPVCDKHGLTRFLAEPYTDVMIVRWLTEKACVVIGTGYYNEHTANEYCVAEDMEKSAALGLELIETLGTASYEIPLSSEKDEEDNLFLKSLGNE